MRHDEMKRMPRSNASFKCDQCGSRKDVSEKVVKGDKEYCKECIKEWEYTKKKYKYYL